MLKTKIAVLVSGGGTNLQALIDAENSGLIKNGEIVLVASNNPNAFALQRAEDNGIKAVVMSSEEALLQVFREEGIELVVLAGFLKILSPAFISAYENRIINIHPSLIPSFCGKGCYGLHVHEKALEYGVKVTGATVHYVNEIPDGGQIIAQKAVEILEGDTPETLQRRVMEQAEWVLLPKAVEEISEKLARGERDPMNVYEIKTMETAVKGNSYVGRGIVLGRSKDGKKAVSAYFIMGRSENSRNRIFLEEGENVMIKPFDESKVEDPSLIIYYPMRKYEDKLIVTNGDQTDTIYEHLQEGKSFEEALDTRCFEPDGPNWTPRISGMFTFGQELTYKMSILKSADAEGSACNRYYYNYPALAGLGHFIHTYVQDGNPLPTFCGEPERVEIPDDIDAFTAEIWNHLDADNKISLYVRYADLETGKATNRMINKNS